MKTYRTKNSLKLILVAIILITLGLGSCSGPHHGSGNHKNHMTNSMGG